MRYAAESPLGLSPLAGVSSKDLNLRPVMTLGTHVCNVKEVPAGQGVSYGLRYSTDKPTTLVLIPLGYADGVPRIAEGAPVRITRELMPRTPWNHARTVSWAGLLWISSWLIWKNPDSPILRAVFSAVPPYFSAREITLPLKNGPLQRRPLTTRL